VVHPSRARQKALKREPTSSASYTALSRQAHEAAMSEPPQNVQLLQEKQQRQKDLVGVQKLPVPEQIEDKIAIPAKIKFLSLVISYKEKNQVI
jgi:hypothetical protein